MYRIPFATATPPGAFSRALVAARPSPTSPGKSGENGWAPATVLMTQLVQLRHQHGRRRPAVFARLPGRCRRRPRRHERSAECAGRGRGRERNPVHRGHQQLPCAGGRSDLRHHHDRCGHWHERLRGRWRRGHQRANRQRGGHRGGGDRPVHRGPRKQPRAARQPDDGHYPHDRRRRHGRIHGHRWIGRGGERALAERRDRGRRRPVRRGVRSRTADRSVERRHHRSRGYWNAGERRRQRSGDGGADQSVQAGSAQRYAFHCQLPGAGSAGGPCQRPHLRDGGQRHAWLRRRQRSGGRRDARHAERPGDRGQCALHRRLEQPARPAGAAQGRSGHHLDTRRADLRQRARRRPAQRLGQRAGDIRVHPSSWNVRQRRHADAVDAIHAR